MATAKLGTLVIRTLAKPLATRIKQQAAQHERFRTVCVNLAQFINRSEIKLRTNILGGEPARHIRPLSETRAIENGANFLAEGFLFSVAAALIVGEAWRSSRSQSKRRDDVDEQLDALASRVVELSARLDALAETCGAQLIESNMRDDERRRILQRVEETGLQRSATPHARKDG